MRLSERLARQQMITLDSAPLAKAIRQLRRALEQSPKAKLYADSLGIRPAIATAELTRSDDGLKVTLHPARDLAMFLRRVRRRHADLPNHD